MPGRYVLPPSVSAILHVYAWKFLCLCVRVFGVFWVYFLEICKFNMRRMKRKQKPVYGGSSRLKFMRKTLFKRRAEKQNLSKDCTTTTQPSDGVSKLTVSGGLNLNPVQEPNSETTRKTRFGQKNLEKLCATAASSSKTLVEVMRETAAVDGSSSEGKSSTDDSCSQKPSTFVITAQGTVDLEKYE